MEITANLFEKVYEWSARITEQDRIIEELKEGLTHANNELEMLQELMDELFKREIRNRFGFYIERSYTFEKMMYSWCPDVKSLLSVFQCYYDFDDFERAWNDCLKEHDEADQVEQMEQLFDEEEES